MPYLLPLLLLLAQDQPAFRSDVALVHVDAEVRQGSRLIDDLKKESFLVTEGGKPQAILYFGHQEEPLDVILLFDTSTSMRPVVRRVAEAGHAAFTELRPGDRVAVMAFDCKTDLIADFTGDFGAAEKSIGNRVLRRAFRRCSPIQQALGEAARHFLKQSNGKRRRAVVIITDDQGTERRSGAVRDLWEADAVVLGVIVRKGGIAANIHIGPPSSYGYRGMRDIAGETGGDALNVNDAAEGLHEMISRLRLRYSLYYALPRGKPGDERPGEERKIRVQLTSDAARGYPGAAVRARTGYVVPGANR
jgi:VWFA-related protein